jgi:hypothetical protein
MLIAENRSGRRQVQGDAKNTPVSSDGWALACSGIIWPVETTEAPQGQAKKKKSRH